MVSSTFSIKALATFLSIASITNAHMIMKSPIPYGKSKINNSPLADDGSDYPCKNLFDMDDPSTDTNYLTPGVANTLSFTGSAVHGGGSCQVSLTTDLKPTKNSKWMVIKSIEGGCPANVDGNLPADPNGNGASTFQYSVPQGFPNGDYTIAWTWFNKIGNREMYMNCGRAVVGAQKKRYAAAQPKIEHRAADYPDILKAQLQIFTCKIPEGANVAYPNPGPAVQTVAAATTFCGGGSNAVATNGGGAASSVVATSVAATSAAATTSAVGFGTVGASTSAAGFGTAKTSAATGTSGSQPTGNPGVFASGAASSAATSAAATSVATVVPVPAASASATAGNSNGSSTPSTGSNVAGSPCSQEGAWACSADGTTFQRCASGVWSVAMQMATGTHCTPGTSMSLSMSGKRDLLSHIHKSNHNRRAILLSA